MDFPTQFTHRQLEKLAELVQRENSRVGNAPGKVVDVELHHLQYKIGDYARNARAVYDRGVLSRKAS